MASTAAGAREELFLEKEFYLDEFRGKTLALVVPWALLGEGAGVSLLVRLARELFENSTRLLLLVGATGGEEPREILEGLRGRPWPGAERAALLFPRGETPPEAFRVLEPDLPEESLRALWSVLGETRFSVAVLGSESGELPGCAVRVARRLGIRKVVFCEREGGIRTAQGRKFSFLDLAMLEALLRPGEAEQMGLGARRATLEAVRLALEEGIAAVNLCSLDGLERELFTYEGSGTLFTKEDYCRVGPLGIDQFDEVRRLVERGQREGFLKERSSEEIAEILFQGYGATIGGNHLAGICGLRTEPYVEEKAGEVVALYTITRFHGEGVGHKLLGFVEKEARSRGLAYLFACTAAERAQAFFEREGFRRVGPEDVPRAKWEGYDAGRKRKVAVFRKDLVARGEGCP
ncbi:MAG: hypothetical protein KatS3mg076_2650 [Candidatus Binatia bacterium]|nr:MAG: hypothetical protein KatS3mg076_2650 [Candidatus Binatia bacterium]